MSFDAQIIQKATARLDENRNIRSRIQEQTRQYAYDRDPEIAKIDRALRTSFPRLVKISIGKEKGVNPQQIREENQRLQALRLERLRALNIDPQFLSNSPSCPHCSDTGWVGARMCQCLHELCTKEQLASLSHLLHVGKQDFAQFSLQYYSDVPWQEFQKSPRQAMEQTHQIAMGFAHNFRNFPIRNLLFTGSTGLGKTFLSACIAKEVANQGFSVVYETAHQFFYHMDVSKFKKATDEEIWLADEATKRYTRCDLLIVDDLGSEITNNATKSSFYNVVNSRLLRQKSTIITTNFPMEELDARYSAPTMSRIQGEYRTIRFFGEDIRLKKKNGTS